MRLTPIFLCLSLILTAKALNAGSWDLGANVGELQPLGQFSSPLTLVNEAEISHQKTDGPVWSLEYETYDQWLLSDFYLLRLERSSWIRPEAAPQDPNRWNVAWSMGWELGVGPGQVSSGPELGLAAEAKIWSKLWVEAKAEQTFYSDAMNSDGTLGFNVKGLFLKGLQIHLGVPVMSVWQEHLQPTWTTQVGLFRAGLNYRWGGTP
jgi:hypothetical protein